MCYCCCEEEEQAFADDCCPDWCSENKKVKGRFGLAFVAETPCCCPEPIGWQIEFCDTPSKVEQRCKEMVQWVNCPPLPRCKPCPPIEVRSPCFPPRCNPCCPITNPCPPPRCCKCCNKPRKECCGSSGGRSKPDCGGGQQRKGEQKCKCKCGRHTTRGFVGAE